MRLRRADHGVTLVELLVVVAISGLIIPVLAGAAVVGWRTTDSTVASLSDSRNRQVAPSLLTRDVQSATTVSTSGSTCTVAGDTLLVRLGWTETDASGTVVVRAASWVLTTGAESLLQRRYCADGTTVASSVTAVHGVVGTPVVTCRSGAGAVVVCGGGTVSVDLAVTDGSGGFTATGRRRSA